MTLELLPAAASQDGLFDWPLFGLHDDIRPALARAKAQGVHAVLATLYDVDGAAPRGVGAQMIITDNMVAGFLSGGCIEADIVAHARHVLANGRSKRLIYGEGGPIDIQLPCGSRIDVLLERIEPDDVAVNELLRFDHERRAAIWFTDGATRNCRLDGQASDVAGPLAALSGEAERNGQVCGRVQRPFGVYRRFSPRRRLMTIGSDPIALAVVKLAVEMGFETLLVRPRGPEACPMPNVQYIRSDVGAAFARWSLDRWTAVAVLGHDVDLEHLALEHSLASQAGYIGVLGSRRRIPERISRLKTSGVSDDELSRIHAPIGLPIGGKSPWEIAVAVMAEIVAELDASGTR